jgi:multisubunit Na+/H+ antiporter MnhB subunit
MKKTFFAVALILLFAFLMTIAIQMRLFGEPVASQMDDYFIENVQAETGVNNVVTGILFDYRGFDTLGEATVLFTAVVGVTVVFKGALK